MSAAMTVKCLPSSTRLYSAAAGLTKAPSLSSSARNRPPFRTSPCAHSAMQTPRSPCCAAQPSCSSASSEFLAGHCAPSSLQQNSASSSQRPSGGNEVRCGKIETVSTRLWRHRWRYMRSESARTNLGLPKADWHRYHLQILFVDRTDTVRARVATGLFERVAEWNGYGRALYPSAAGVDAEGGAPNVATTASLLSMAGMLGIRAKIFAAQRERFDYDDFDRHDIIVAMDDSVLEDILGIAGGPSDKAWYAPRCTTLTAFSRYCGGLILRGGGSGVLEPELRAIVAPVLQRACNSAGISRPNLGSGPEEWNMMVEDIVVACAGLVQYLADAYPPDLPEYDPV